jgi:hypothetical protein
MGVISDQKVVAFIRAALECSVYLSPCDPGLTTDELFEIGRRAGYQTGELGDALPRLSTRQLSGDRLGPDEQTIAHWQIFAWKEEPDYRVIPAFDFVASQFNELIRAEGAARARVERSVLVERAVAGGIGRQDVEAALSIMLFTGQLIEKNSLLMRPHGGSNSPLPSEQQRSAHGSPIARPMRERAYHLVKDVIERRSDARPTSIEAFDAFSDALIILGYEPFRLWWCQTVGELRRADILFSPTTVAVLSAALLEGVLTFVVRHARLLSVGPMGSKTFEGDPRTWKIDDLVKSAAMGNESAIVNPTVRLRAERLIAIRQRIHAGRVLSEFPGGPPDLRPEEARESRETAEVVVRSVLDWLQRYPPR